MSPNAYLPMLTHFVCHHTLTYQSSNLHDQGVYCADTVGARLCTASKDGTVAFAALASDAIRMTRRVELSRVVKVARFDREQPVVAAAAGNAGDVWILDARVAARGGVVLTLEDAHGGRCVNSVRWCGGALGAGSGSALLATCGLDPYCRVWDVRRLLGKATERGAAESGAESRSPTWTFSGAFILFTVTFCTNPGNNLTCPPHIL